MAKAQPLEFFIGFGKYTFEHEGKLWAALKSNKGDGKYSFTDDSFTLPVEVFSGLIDGDDYWLVCTLTPFATAASSVFDIQIREQNDGKWTVNKEEGEKQSRQYQNDGSLTLINVNDIPALKVLVKVASELKVILRTPNNELLVNLMLTSEVATELEQHVANFWVQMLTGEKPKPGTDAYNSAGTLAQAGLMSFPVLSNDKLPSVTLKDMFGEPTETIIKCFPFSGELPAYEALLITPPKAAEKKKSGGYGGGATVTTTVTGYLAPSDRAKYICDSLRAMGCGIPTDDVAGLALFLASGSTVKEKGEAMLKTKIAFQMTSEHWILD